VKEYAATQLERNTDILPVTKNLYHDIAHKKIGGPILRQAANLFSANTPFNRLTFSQVSVRF